MKAMRSALNKILNVLAGGSLTVMVLLTTYQVITRYVFSSPSTLDTLPAGSSSL